MRIDIVPTVRHQIHIAPRVVRSGIQCRFYLCKLINREAAVAEAERVVVHAGHDVEGPSVGCSGLEDGADGEFFAEGVGVFAVDLVLED